MEERYRLGVLVDGEWRAHTYPGVFNAAGPELAVAPAGSPVELLIALLDVLPEPLCLELHVLDSDELEVADGHIAVVSSAFSRQDLSNWLRHHAHALESDARLAVSVESASGRIVYDEHNQLLLTGEWRQFEAILLANGLTPGDTSVPMPHAHHYRAEVTDELKNMLAPTGT